MFNLNNTRVNKKDVSGQTCNQTIFYSFISFKPRIAIFILAVLRHKLINITFNTLDIHV